MKKKINTFKEKKQNELEFGKTINRVYDDENSFSVRSDIICVGNVGQNGKISNTHH